MYLIANNFKKICIFDKYVYKKSILIKRPLNFFIVKNHNLTQILK